MKAEEVKALVEQNKFTRENTCGTLSDERLDEMNTHLLASTIVFEPVDEDSALEIIKTISDRMINQL